MQRTTEKIPLIKIDMATSDKIYDNQVLAFNLDSQSKEYDYNMTKESGDKVLTNYKVVAFINAEYGSMIITKNEKESDEKNEKYVVEDEVVVEKKGN